MKLLKFKYTNLVLSFFLGFCLFIATTCLFLYLTAPRIPLLGFHGIVDLERPDQIFAQGQAFQKIAYTKQDLEKVLDYLVRRDYWFLSTQDLYNFFVTKSKQIPAEYVGRKPIMFSFDDGYKTDYVNLVPILENLEKKYNRKAKVVLFVNSGNLANSKNIASTKLSCSELREGMKKGFYDVQSHGLTHANLTRIDEKTLIKELSQAKTILRNCTKDLDPDNQVGAHIAYPYGAANKQVETYASKYYLSGYLYDSKILRFCWLKDRYAISRLTINRGKSPEQLIQMAERSHRITKNDKC